jgi:hypothetical protein
MKGYVIAVRQVGAPVGILKKENKVLLFSAKGKARKYAREEKVETTMIYNHIATTFNPITVI